MQVPMVVLPSKQRCQPQMPVSQSSQPYPALPCIPQPQLKVRERPKLYVLNLLKYSPSFWSLALLLKE